MDRKRRLYWGRYLRDLADRMELRDWTVSIAHRPAEEGANAEVTCTYGKKYAVIALSKEFDQRTSEENRLTCVHELIHCHLADMNHHIKNTGVNVEKLWFTNLRWALSLAEENAVSAIADGWAKHLPLPPVDEKTKRKKGKA